MRYRPRSSVTTKRTFSIRAGLAASTVTPGITAPDVSLTTPAMAAPSELCAQAAAGSNTKDHSIANKDVVRRIGPPDKSDLSQVDRVFWRLMALFMPKRKHY